MIGKLKGIVDTMAGSHVIIDVNGVGYAVTCSAHTLRQLAIGSPATLFIETHVREDAISLFGFAESAEQDWFKLLTTVQGVGAKVALSILGTVSPHKLAHVIAAQDKAALTEADGVGPKLGLRIVTELKDKVQTLSLPATTASLAGKAAPLDVSTTAARDAVSALINLGYRRAEVFGVVTSLQSDHKDAKLDELIRLSLAELSRKDSAA